MQQALKLNIPQSSCNPYLTYLPPVSFLSKYIDSSRRYLPATSSAIGVPLYKKSRTKHTVRPVIIHNTVFCELGASPFWRQSLSEYCPHRNCSLCRGCLLCCVCSDTWLRVTGFPRVCLFTNFILFL